MCGECGYWVDVDEREFQRYLARELHREQVENDRAEREAEFLSAPILMDVEEDK